MSENPSEAPCEYSPEDRRITIARNSLEIGYVQAPAPFLFCCRDNRSREEML